MKTYEYQILRYRHDIFTGEFVNVGIVVFLPEEKEIRSMFIKRYKRISDFFYGINGSRILSIIRAMDLTFKRLNNKIKEDLDFEGFTSIERLTTYVLPKDDSALQFASVHKGLTLNIDRTAEELFETFVSKYESIKEKKSRSDDEAWKDVYKKYFDSKGITDKLKPNKIKTIDDEFEFDLAIKNGKWNYFKPLSFDLVENEDIKNKVYKWAGVAQELLTSSEPFNFYFLALEPGNKTPELEHFIERKLKVDDNIHKIKVVTESEVEHLVTELKEFINEHE